MEFDLTILALTHTNKSKHDDDISKISGSDGMAGGTDGNWVLTILQAREPILVSYSAAVFSKSLKAAQDSLREIYGVSYVSAFHNKKKWITLDYIEVK